MTSESELAGLTEVQRELFEAVTEERSISLECILRPCWDRARRFVGWEYYVPEVVEKLWEGLPIEAKLVAALEAVGRQSSDDLPLD